MKEAPWFWRRRFFFLIFLVFLWLIDYLLFYVPLKNISLIWRRHHCRWRAAKFRPMLGAQGLWAGRDLYRATPAVTRDLGFSGLIRRTAPFSRLLRHAWGCGGPILTRILTGPLYFYIFAIISPWKWPMVIIWTNLNPLPPNNMIWAKFGWNWPSGSREDFF
jgi:hypothetical protein